jgi:hypothetical protein
VSNSLEHNPEKKIYPQFRPIGIEPAATGICYEHPMDKWAKELHDAAWGELLKRARGEECTKDSEQN